MSPRLPVLLFAAVIARVREWWLYVLLAAVPVGLVVAYCLCTNPLAGVS